MKLSVFGLGKLGSVIAAVNADADHEVVGVDPNSTIVDLINAGSSPFEEPELDSLIHGSEGRLSATTDGFRAVLETDISIVIVPTPSRIDGSFSNEYVASALTVIGSAIKQKSSRHTVVISSTVRPGSMNGELKEVLEASSGKIVGRDVGLVYNPAFIALGSIVSDMRYPDMLLIGESDSESGDLVAAISNGYVQSNPRINRMSLVDAEITKIAVNTYVTTKISFANMLSELCDYIPGSDVHTITRALGDDTRIGSKYIRAATAYGGPCFPRDNKALSELGNSLGVKMSIAEATDVINNRQSRRLVNLIRRSLEPPAKVAILGLAYKPSTPVVEGSQGIQLANELESKGFRVSVSDPMGLEAAKAALNSGVTCFSFAYEAIEGAEAVAIMTAWPEYTLISFDESVRVFDPWLINESVRSEQNWS